MTYLFLIFIALAVSLLLLRLRVRVALEPDRWLIFLGLGQSGPEFDFAAKKGRIKLLGWSVRSFPLGAKKKSSRAGKKKDEKKADDKKRSARVRSWRDMVRIVPSVVTALWSFMLDLLRSAVIEELEGKIEAGFDSPDLTGRAFGYYQAALATVPGVAGRFAYVPDWSGASFGGSLRLAIALPLYQLVFRMMMLIARLPLRELIKLAIGKKKGGQDG